ncbi:MAG: transglycosylase SLT domain-containing protein [Sulfuritalea sp.]|nr:transglycosylase SLT domain-containing protein [Sulfuritalea sp.]
MSATLTNRYLIATRVNSFLNYLHLDFATIGLALLLVLAAGVANYFNSRQAEVNGAATIAVATRLSVQAVKPAEATVSLSPAMEAALDQVSQRYRVSADALEPVFLAVQTAARQRGVDPLLIIAVISIESRFNPFSQSPMGAQGLMQIIPRYHQDKALQVSVDSPFLDPIANVQMGTQILQEFIRQQGGVMEGLQYYNGASGDEEQAYANKVLAEKQRLERAQRRVAVAGKHTAA